MSIVRYASSLASVLLIFSYCSPQKGVAVSEGMNDSSHYRILPPKLPINLHKAEEQAAYLVEHYWDGAILPDSLKPTELQYLEDAVVDYLGLTQSLPEAEALRYVLTPLEKSSGNTLISILSIYWTYLYSGDSPLASDNLYRPVLEWAIHTPKLSRVYQEQAKALLERINMNQIGDDVSNFIYSKLDDSKHHLRNQTAPKTLLLIGMPQCPSCQRAIEALSENVSLQRDIQSGELSVLFIYIQCSAEEFVEDASRLPDWIQAGYDYSGEILNKPLYDIKASPTIYLFNRAGKVLYKDLHPERLSTLTLIS